MKNRLFRMFNVFVTLILVMGLIWSGAPATAQETPPAGSPLDILADARGVKAADLTLQDVATFTLLDGREVQRIKALDVKGEIVGGDFSNGVEVNLADLQAEAGKAWRAEHGALTPGTVERLAALDAKANVDISIWLAGELQEAGKEDYNPLKPEGEPETVFGSPEEMTAEASADGEDYSPPVVEVDGEWIVEPLPLDQVPEYVLNADVPGESILPAERTPEEQEAGLLAAMEAIPGADPDGSLEAAKQAATAQLDAQVGALQAGFAERLASLGLKADYASPIMPSVVINNVPVSLVYELASWPEIDAIYLVPDQAGDTLDDARPAQNANLVNSAGYNGTGVKVAVLEGERAFFANPKLVLAGCYPCGGSYESHPTAVAGFIKSTASGYYGLANDASVYSVHGTYSTWSKMTEAMDWASTNTTVINNSWYWDWENEPKFWEADRRLDYIVRYRYDFVTVAAGNFGSTTACVPANPGFCSDYVTSPAKGYNVLTVANHNDFDNTNWSDDAMSSSSSWGDPGSDTSSPKHSKPEVSAIGTTLDSTLKNSSEPYIGAVGSGTSYASPMVAALAADLIEAKPTLSDQPESLRAIIMATALQNVEGSARLSDKDGTGAVDFSAALVTAERDHFSSQYVSSSTTYPLTLSMYAHKGERVRYVITWLSNPNSGYTTDVLPADLDLTAYRADGTTAIASSSSSVNNYEIVDFIAPASETYKFKVSKWSFSGSGTWLGSAGWRGEYRNSPDTYYSYGAATPMGMLQEVHPADWPEYDDWEVFAIRSVDSDHDLTLYDESYVGNPGIRDYVKASTYGTSNPIDLIVWDGNHRDSALVNYFRVNKFSGTGSYRLNWDYNSGTLSPSTGPITKVYGPYTKSTSLPADIRDVYLTAGTWRILVTPRAGNTSDLSMYLFDSSPGTSSTWVQAASQAATYSNASSDPQAIEGFYITVPAADRYGLVISGINYGKSDYYIKINQPVLPYKMYMPMIDR